MSIQKQLLSILEGLPKQVHLVAVSKTKPNANIEEAYAAGQRIFGENKIQEMTQKWETLPKDIQWHMIGNVQTNKVKYMAPYVSLIHGVDRYKLLKEINKQAAKSDRVIDCLLQMHIAQEDSKFGFNKEELQAVVIDLKTNPLPHIRIKGLMGMATFTDNQDQIRSEFKMLKQQFNWLQTQHPEANELSMGMSGDYALAIEEGSTMIRVGSKIFGSRNY
ncbi:YggS family pyridoxal phosphate-dependent enzyme [Flavobacteriaceae bacterium]|nr:YggS family pyridoxal phosphate-dependent enzyme [Flavobacteriaceae bacterium]MDB9988435.1 YggS family pyridoxal phosphate-dependent enzyme [Flavobacteriaceae bacterium]|tara:strand:- start:1899 stop:2555 length:657 start_codon:yes stop_codon:yes gene_type:complete